MIAKFTLSRLFSVLFVVITAIAAISCQSEADKTKKELENFIADFEQKVIPLEKEYNLASYKASISGEESDFKNAANIEIALTKIYSNKESFAKLKAIKESGLIKDSLLLRQLNILYNKFLINQIDESKLTKIVMLENEIHKKFTTYRPKIDNRFISDREIEEVLRTSTDSKKLEKYWRASKKVGREIDDDLIKLVKMRNEVAKELGFNDYYEMMLITSGQSPDELDELFDEVDILTRGPYSQLKQEIDQYLSELYKVPVDDLKPWHYQNRFFQEPPSLYQINLDKYYENKDLVDIAKQYFKGVGLDLDNVFDNSDLYPKPKKSQLAFTKPIDRDGDVRITANIGNDSYSMYILLYEGGFASTYKYIDKNLPYLLREPANFLISDAIGNIFGRLVKNPQWLKTNVGITEQEAQNISDIAMKNLRLEKFVFSRWAQVVYRFERELYRNPDQNLNELWWHLVQNYQLINKPSPDRDEPDWASKTHLITVPCTYHNYLLGELLASQLCAYMQQNIINPDKDFDLSNDEKIGKFLIDKIISKGASQDWNQIVKEATGEKLTADYFTKQFINIK